LVYLFNDNHLIELIFQTINVNPLIRINANPLESLRIN